jgi:C1A family cysteine protease
MESTEAAARTKTQTDDFYMANPYDTVEKNGDYLYVDDGESTPSVSKSVLKGIKGASTPPASYMNSLAQLVEKYPNIRDQGDYNTCWAFSAAGLAEFDLITDNLTADRTVDLSEYQITYFTYHNQTDTFGGTAGDSLTTLTDYLQFGGNLDYTSRTLLQWQGVAEELLMPYSNSLVSSQSFGSSYAFDQDVAHLQNAYIINIHTNQSAVKQEIMNHGSAGIGLYMDATSPLFNKQAVYEATGETVATYYCPYSGKYDQAFEANHALNIVGWDDDFPASAFAIKPAGNGAWLARNSWSDATENDINSYFWISYYDNGIEDEAWIFDFESADNYDYNYQYDGCSTVYGLNGLLMVGSTRSSVNATKYANVFQVQGASNELLRAVSVSLNEDSNVSYKIRIYTNLSDPSDPKSGCLTASVSGRTTYAGTYTIPLDKAVSLPKGTYYSVIVDLGSAGTGIDAEFSYNYQDERGRTVLTSRASVSKNQSFIYYKNKWMDLSNCSSIGIGNLCIKAYTDKTGTSLAKTSGLKSSSIKKTSAKLSWAKTDGADGYQVYRSTTKNGTYKKVATVKSRSYTNTKLTKNTTYYYKVRAYKKVNGNTVFGKLSSAVKVTTKKK